MSTLALAARDSSTMVRRQLKRLVRYPSMTVLLIGRRHARGLSRSGPRSQSRCTSER